MLSKQQTVKLAEEYTQEGFLCSESVLLALSKSQNISSDIIPKIATGFGAGIGSHGEVCGALAGAVIGLGLQFGRTTVDETPPDARPYKYAQTMVDLFVSRFGHIRCRDLIGLDLTSEDARAAYRDQKLWETRCRDFIKITTGLAFDLLMAQDQE